jgi:hypothetical protein
VIVPIVLAEVGFHALGVLEVYVSWWLIQGSAPTWLIAFILEGANRFIAIVRKVRVLFWVLVGTSLLVRRGFK